MENWTSHNNPGRQYLTAALAFIAGAVLMIGFRSFEFDGGNAMAGFFLGVLLVVIAVWSFVVSGTQTIVVNPRLRRIEIEDVNRFRSTKRMIPFTDVIDITIGYIGKRSSFVRSYYLELELRSGERYSLFAPGRYYEGCSDRGIVEGWRRRLTQYIDGIAPL